MKKLILSIPLLSEELRNKWNEVGGWYENPDDPEGWSTTKTTEFVSAYAHGKNPNEDFAESVSFFIINPDKLRSDHCQNTSL